MDYEAKALLCALNSQAIILGRLPFPIRGIFTQNQTPRLCAPYTFNGKQILTMEEHQGSPEIELF